MNQQLSQSLRALHLPQFHWLCQLSCHYFCLAVPSEIAVWIKYLLFLSNCALKSMPTATCLQPTFFLSILMHGEAVHTAREKN